jgi:fluoride exporter
VIPLAIAIGAAIGAPARYFTDRYVQSRTSSVFPWGTLTVNAAGSLILGALVGSGASGTLAALAGVGFCGALTTYSTLGYETHRLMRDRSMLLAALNVASSLVVGLAAASIGYGVAAAVVA